MRFQHCLRVTAAVMGALVLLALRPATAAVVVFNCTGIITNGGTDRDVFDASVGPGTPFAATFQVRTTANDLNARDPNAWAYVDHEALNEAFVTFGNYSLSPNPTDVLNGPLNGLAGVNNSGSVDMYQWQSDGSAGTGLNAAFVMASLQDNSGTAITAKGLPPVGPGLSDITRWSSAELTFMAARSATGPRRQWYGTITSINTSIQPNTVPEPGSLYYLAMAGLSGLAITKRRLARGC